MKCYKCGSENVSGSKVCSTCHASLDIRKINPEFIDTTSLKLVDIEEAVKPKEVQKSSKAPVIIVALVLVAGIVATVVLPMYNEYVIAGKVKEVIVKTRAQVERYARENRSWPSSAEDIGLRTSQQGEVIVRVRNGIIEISLAVHPDQTATFLPGTNASGYIVWECAPGKMNKNYLPALCK